MRTAAMLAGGLGTRLAVVTDGLLPKALVPVGGHPFLYHKLRELERLGVGRVVLLLGAHAEQIVEYVEKTSWGLDVRCETDGDILRGTGGAIKHAITWLPDAFWVTYGDTLLDVDLAAVEGWAGERALSGVMTVLRNDDRWQRSNVRLDGDLVASYDKAAAPGSHQYLDYGYLLLSKSAFLPCARPCFDLSEVLRPLIAARRLGGFPVTARFHEIGTVDALAETERWLAGCGRP